MTIICLTKENLELIIACVNEESWRLFPLKHTDYQNKDNLKQELTDLNWKLLQYLKEKF